MNQSIKKFLTNYLWICLLILGAIGFLIVWLFMPHEREIFTKWPYIVKIIIFILVIMGVSLFPNTFKFGYLLTALPFFIFLGFIIPRLTFYFLSGPQTEPEYYTYLWVLLYPGIMLSIIFALRIGGASPGICTKIGVTGLIILFSGYLELLWFVVNPANYVDMPSIPHIEVILGFKPSYRQLIIFALCHIPLVIGVHALPLDKWYHKYIVQQ